MPQRWAAALEVSIMKFVCARRIAIAVIALLAWAFPAVAATESVLFSFKDYKSAYPLGRLRFVDGSLYGSSSGYWRAPTYGQIFKLTKSGGAWKKTALVTFDNKDGSTPYGTVVRDSSGVLYGTTSGGDKYNSGNVFALVNRGGKWLRRTIWAFGAKGDGISPTCDLVIDRSGNLYGTTYSGGAYNGGIAFELSKIDGTWSETILHNFGAAGDGWDIYAGLLMAAPDTFYGTTIYGGNAGGDGTVFELFKSGGVWKEQVIFSFDGANGYEPWGTLIMDKDGELYGTTYAGGSGKTVGDVGVVFMLSPSGSTWSETVLHNFGSTSRDGENPMAGLTWGRDGVLYGTTSGGGGAGPGGGTAFVLRPSHGAWEEAILHVFGRNGDDGGPPQGGVILDRYGNLYGTGVGGGKYNYGVVWKITP